MHVVSDQFNREAYIRTWITARTSKVRVLTAEQVITAVEISSTPKHILSYSTVGEHPSRAN